MVEARFGAPRGEVRAAVVAEYFLETGNDFSGAWIARGNWAARAGIAALEIHFSDAEAHGAAFFRAKQLILPERRDTVDFERGTEAPPRFVDRHARKEIANGLQACGGDDCRAAGDIIVRKTFGRMAYGDGLLEEIGKPNRGGGRVAWEGKCLGWDFALVPRNRNCDGAEIRRECRAHQVDRPAARANARFVRVRRIERLDRMQANVR